jgi:uncharacterized protein (TIGR00299 family) protein
VKAVWFHCFAGIAGDMTLAALLDAGADIDEVRSLLQRLPVSGWQIETSAVTRGGVGGTHVDVRVQERGIVRTHAHIVGLVEEARLPERVRDRSLAVFGALAEAEGRVHRRPPSQVHFHEVGGMDAIVDVVGSCAALETLGIDVVRASPVATGVGMVRTAHGMLPNPAPAVVELLRGAPTYGREVSVELTTPTGAALLAALANGFGAMPRMTIETTGFGAGTRELQDLPNLLQAVIGELQADDTTAASGQPVVLLEVNVDDATGEVLAHTIGALLEKGAHDAWITPVVMKKGRPAYTVSALADPVLADQIARVLTDETGSFGVRGTRLERWPSARMTDIVEVDGQPVRIKVGPGRAKAEHDDAARVARTTGAPLRDVTARAEAAWRGRLEAVPDDGGDESA